MKRKVIDSFYSSELKQMHAGQDFDPDEFEVSDDRMAEFQARGFIAPVAGRGAKSEAAPLNKAEPPLENKIESTVSLDDPGAASKLISKTRKRSTL